MCQEAVALRAWLSRQGFPSARNSQNEGADFPPGCPMPSVAAGAPGPHPAVCRQHSERLPRAWQAVIMQALQSRTRNARCLPPVPSPGWRGRDPPPLLPLSPRGRCATGTPRAPPPEAQGVNPEGSCPR